MKKISYLIEWCGDETWARSLEPKLKIQNAEWRLAHSPSPIKAIRGLTKLKSMGDPSDLRGSSKTTVTRELYRWVLVHKLRPALLQKEPDILETGPILLHDGAGPH